MVAITRAKRKAAEEASRTGDLPEQPKPKAKRRRAAVGPPPEVLQRACVITKDTLAFDLSVTLRSGRHLWVPNTAKPGPLQFRKGEQALYDTSWRTPSRRCRSRVDKRNKSFFDGIMVYFWWNIWKERNRRIFNHQVLASEVVAYLTKEDIQRFNTARRLAALFANDQEP